MPHQFLKRGGQETKVSLCLALDLNHVQVYTLLLFVLGMCRLRLALNNMNYISVTNFPDGIGEFPLSMPKLPDLTFAGECDLHNE